MNSSMEVLIYVITLLILFPFTAFALAKLDLFWTLVESGNIKYIYHGDTLWKVIADVDGKKIQGYELVDLNLGEEVKKPWFGMYWIGFPPFVSIKKFTIKLRKEYEETAGKRPEEWIRDLGQREVNSLRYAFPRPFLLQKVELSEDRQIVDLLVVCKFLVVNAYLPVAELKGDFFELTGSILKGAITDIIKEQKNIQTFLTVPKGEGGILEPLTDKDSLLNKALRKRTGLRLVGITIPEWDPSDPATREAMSKQFIAEKVGEASVTAANKYKEQLGITNEADALAIERTARARSVHVRAVREALEAIGANPDESVRAAAKVLQAESLTGLTTFVEGGAPVVVPVGGNKS